MRSLYMMMHNHTNLSIFGIKALKITSMIICTELDAGSGYRLQYASPQVLTQLRCESLNELKGAIEWGTLQIHSVCETTPMYEETTAMLQIAHPLGHRGSCTFSCQLVRVSGIPLVVMLRFKDARWTEDEQWDRMVDTLYFQCCVDQIQYKTVQNTDCRPAVAIPMCRMHMDEWTRRCAHHNGTMWNQNVNLNGRTMRCALVPQSILSIPVRFLIHDGHPWLITDSSEEFYECTIVETHSDMFPVGKRLFCMLTAALTMAQLRRLVVCWKEHRSNNVIRCTSFDDRDVLDDDASAVPTARWIRRKHYTLWSFDAEIARWSGVANAETSAGGAALPS